MKTSILFSKIFSLALVIGAIAIASMPPQVVQAATATKTILEPGAHNPGDQVTVQIKFNKPSTTTTITPVQVMIALDDSGSTANQLDDTKTKLTNFANSLSSYYGYVQVGIYGFGAGSASFPSAVIDSSNIANLKTAINNIAVGGNDTGFSDIYSGINTANGKFTGSGSKFLILQTDGFDNQPNGGCPIAMSGSSRVPGVSGVGSTDFSIVPIQSNPGNGAGYTGKLGYSTNDTDIGGADPCRDYVNNNFNNYPNTQSYCMSGEYYRDGTYACDMLRDMTTTYSNAHLDSTIQPQLDKVIAAAQNAQKISSITVSDLLNSSVFDTNPSSPTFIVYQGGGFTDCNGTALATKSFTTDGTGRFTFISNSSNLNNVSQYCLVVKATIIPNPTTGTVPINSSSGNTVTYKNTDGSTLAQDLIGAGQIQINGSNLTVDQLMTTDSSGVQKYVFTTSDTIYATVTAHNTLSTSSGTGAVTTFYENEPNPVSVGKASTMPPSPGMYITHGVFGPNSSYTYGSAPGGNYNSSYSSVKSWQTNSTGPLTLRAYINYNNAVSESNYNDNQAAVQYGVIVNPSNLNAVANSCNKATFSWSAGSGVTSYSIRLRNLDDSTEKVYAAGSGTSFSATDLVNGPHNYSWWLTPQVMLDGTLRDGTAISGNNFTTPVCKIFSINPVNNIPRVSPGAGDVPQDLTYTFNNGPWSSSDKITTAVLKIASGSIDCSGVAYPGSNASLNGLSAGIGSTSTGSATTSWPNGPTPLEMNASPTTPFGTYTICIGARSATADNTPANIAVVISVYPSGWLQIGTSPASGLFAGDVHSNGNISSILLPTPTSSFFTAGVAGVVSADTAINIKNGQITAANGSGPNPPDWVAANYVQVSTNPYTQLYNNALDSQPNGSLPGTGLVNGTFNAKCGKNGGVFLVTDTTPTIDHDVDWSNKCDGTDLIFFVNGDLAVNNNIVDTSNTGTLTFIIKGNLTVSSNVTEMDGVYLFGGTFNDGGGSNQLLVKGSLLGLAGKTAGANTGSFYQSGNTGLSRDLGQGNAAGLKNATDPAELIIYQPKYLATVKDWLGSSTFSWSE